MTTTITGGDKSNFRVGPGSYEAFSNVTLKASGVGAPKIMKLIKVLE
jgi:hypothetical protein